MKVLVGIVFAVIGFTCLSNMIFAQQWESHIESSSQVNIKQNIRVKQESSNGYNRVRVTQSITACDETVDTSIDSSEIPQSQIQQRKEYFQGMLDQVKQLVEKLDKSGRDVSKLNAMIPEMEKRIHEANQNIATITTPFEEERVIECEDENGSIRTKIVVNQGKPQDYSAESEKVKSYYFSTIRPALLETWQTK